MTANGFIDGVDDDAPDEVKKAFAEYWKNRKKSESAEEPAFKY